VATCAVADEALAIWSSEALMKINKKIFITAAKHRIGGIPYSITERRVPELIPVLGSQPAGDVSHKPVTRR